MYDKILMSTMMIDEPKCICMSSGLVLCIQYSLDFKERRPAMHFVAFSSFLAVTDDFSAVCAGPK
jgi:hypothetical protein